MITRPFDYTVQFNEKGYVNLDTAGYETIIVHIIGMTGTFYFNHSNDGGAIQGELPDNSPQTAINFEPVQGTNLATGSQSVSTATIGLYRFQYIGQYLQITNNAGTPNTVTKLLVTLSKIC
jgi:hypothetical protein